MTTTTPKGIAQLAHCLEISRRHHGDLRIAYGLFTVPPPIVNVPDGWTVVRTRFRTDDVCYAYLRKGGTFARWCLRYTEDRKALEPWYIQAYNVRSSATTEPDEGLIVVPEADPQ